MNSNAILKNIGKIADKYNFEVYVVGGFVRDQLLGYDSKDIDFVVIGDGPTFAEKVSQELPTSDLVIYKKFGTAMLKYGGAELEFVGARSESYRSDSRKPTVEQTDLLGDLARRDFTINAIAMGLNQGNFGDIVDPYDGRGDIERKIIRTPLEPEQTFFDDPLRIMRAIRFACRLDYKIHKDTQKGIINKAERLSIISQERITDELEKILMTKKPSIGFYLMSDLDVLPKILPEVENLRGVDQVENFRHKDVFHHTLKVMDNIALVSEELKLRYVALFHDIAKPPTKRFQKGIGWTFHGHDDLGAKMFGKIGLRLKLSTEIIKYVQKMILLHLRPISLAEEGVSDSAVRRLLFQAGDDADDLILFCRADITSGNPQRVQRHLANFDKVAERMVEVEAKDRIRNFEPPVDGMEIMHVCNLKPGPQVGVIKKAIEEAILEGEIPNEYQAAFDYMLKIKEELL